MCLVVGSPVQGILAYYTWSSSLPCDTPVFTFSVEAFQIVMLVSGIVVAGGS